MSLAGRLPSRKPPAPGFGAGLESAMRGALPLRGAAPPPEPPRP
jgi:hypothetical protein